ncbi:MAG: TIGR00266 family protein [Myxococcota bacterium]
MRHELVDKPDFTIARVVFDAEGEQLVTEASAMVARDGDVQMSTSLRGGALGAMKRKLLGGESLFQNTFTASAPGQALWVAPGPEGDVEVLDLDGNTPVYLQSGAYLASAPTVELDTQWGGARGFFSGAGLFLLEARGQGPLFFACYGGLHAVDVGPQGYVCDTGHIVAFTGGLDYRVTKVGGLKSLLLSGEGLVAEFHGTGRLWVATRSPGALAGFLQPFRPVRRSN